MYEESLKVGLSFSGGGARGIAHIGVLQALLEANIEPQVLAGASAGSVVGVLYAAGFSPAEMLAFLRESSILKAVSIGLPNGGFTKLSYLKERLTDVIPADDFSELKKPLYIAISNLNTGRLVIKNSGPLFDIIVASCSIPLVFQPVEIGGEMFVDGGLLCNLPVDPLVREADYVIGVNVVPENAIGSEEFTNMVSVAYRSFDMSILANSRPQATRCDFLLEPTGIDAFRVFHFNKVEEIYQLGYETTKVRIPELKASMVRKNAELLRNY